MREGRVGGGEGGRHNLEIQLLVHRVRRGRGVIKECLNQTLVLRWWLLPPPRDGFGAEGGLHLCGAACQLNPGHQAGVVA